MYENTLRKYHEAIDKGLSYKYAVQGVLYDDLSQARSMQFMRYVIVWMLRLVSPGHDYPAKQPRYVFFVCLLPPRESFWLINLQIAFAE